MDIAYWGVRGSIASPGVNTVRYGGETSCVSVDVAGIRIILDAGTGIRQLGKYCMQDSKPVYLLISHRHMDHIRGFPFFEPIYHREKDTHLFSYPDVASNWFPSELMDGVFFPRRSEEIPGNLIRVKESPADCFTQFGIEVETFPVNHPGGAFGFSISDRETRFVHVPDNELDEESSSYADLVDKLGGVTVLSHDAQFLDEDLPVKRGWGHSTVRAVCDLALKTRPETLVLFHHDPSRSDDQLDSIGRAAAEVLGPENIQVRVAHQGMTMQI